MHKKIYFCIFQSEFGENLNDLKENKTNMIFHDDLLLEVNEEPNEIKG